MHTRIVTFIYTNEWFNGRKRHPAEVILSQYFTAVNIGFLLYIPQRAQNTPILVRLEYMFSIDEILVNDERFEGLVDLLAHSVEVTRRSKFLN
jgi:hypothetical protein